MHRDSLVLLNLWGVLYSLAVVLQEEFYRHIRRDSAGNSTTVYFFVYKY